MNDAPLTPDIAAAASTAATSPSLRFLPLHPRGEGYGEGEGEREGLEAVTDKGVAVGNQGRPRLPSPPPPSSPVLPSFSLSGPLSLVCCSQSASRRPENEAVWWEREREREAQGEIMKERGIEWGRAGEILFPPRSKHAFCWNVLYSMYVYCARRAV